MTQAFSLLAAAVATLLPGGTDAFVGRVSRSATATTTALKSSGMDEYEAQMRTMFTVASHPPPPASSVSAKKDPVISPPPESIGSSQKLAQRWRKKTKQLATLGPASSTFEMIEKLFLAGADVFRLNFSHGEHGQKKDLLDIIRQVEAKYDHPIAVLGDLQGPKLRVGTFANPDGESLKTGQAFRLDLDYDKPGTAERVVLPHPEIIEASEAGHVLLIDDGKVKLQVTKAGPGYLDCVVVVGGKIKDKKVSTTRVSGGIIDG